MALGTCCGARKGEFLDPNIKFYTYAEWKRRQGRDATTIPLGTDADHLNITNPDAELGSHLLVQVKVLKDTDQKSNKYQDSDGALVPNRVVIKPTLFYDAQEIVDKIAAFRKKYNITKASFTNRVSASNNWGSALFKPVLKQFYHSSWAKSKQKGWSIGSHFGRKLYAVASFGVYKDSVQTASSEIVREASWISMVLAHQGSVATSLSYANVQVNFNIKPSALEMPNDKVIEEIYRELIFLRGRVDTLTKQTGIVVTANKQQAGFVKADGTIVNLERHSKRKYVDEQDRKDVFDGVAADLTRHGLPITQENVAKLGLGRSMQRDFIDTPNKRTRELPSNLAEQKHEQPNRETPAAPKAAEAPNRPDAQQTKTRKRHKEQNKKHTESNPGKYHTLQDNEKVIAPKPKGEKAREIAHQRDKEVFGEDKVIQEEECEGKVTEEVELSKKKWRKLCVE